MEKSAYKIHIIGAGISGLIAAQILENHGYHPTIIEASAGNTAMGLALIAKLKGYKAKVVILDKMNKNKILHLKAIGAEIIMARSDVGPDHPEHYIAIAKKLADEMPNSFFASQFTNMSNPLAHELTTAPEIYNQLDGDVDAIVCGVGSGGTISGIGKYFNEHSPKTLFFHHFLQPVITAITHQNYAQLILVCSQEIDIL